MTCRYYGSVFVTRNGRFVMFFDSPYYLQSSVGLETLYYRAAIELLQCDCELGAMESLKLISKFCQTRTVK